jgi:hypothetical protein
MWKEARQSRTRFDVDDLDVAFEELDARYQGGEDTLSRN